MLKVAKLHVLVFNGLQKRGFAGQNRREVFKGFLTCLRVANRIKVFKGFSGVFKVCPQNKGFVRVSRGFGGILERLNIL